jgi:NAD(P)-dependent dehydrogenase (short-subunit alcohol dehydrogenase family)
MSGNRKMSRRESLMLAGGTLAGIPVGALGAQLAKDKGQAKGQMSGKVALVTGGARGIGRAVAMQLAASGASVVICDIASQIDSVKYPLATTEELNRTAEEITSSGGRCIAVQADVRDREAMGLLAERIESEFGKLDTLVVNAGIASMERFDSESTDAWDNVIEVNLIGAANSVRPMLPLLRASGAARIVCVASQLARKGASNSTAYVASKWGMVGFAKSLALEEGRNGITCNVVCPTATDTGMLNNAYVLGRLSPDNPTIEALNERWGKAAQIPGAILTPEQVADMVVFLCDERSAHISGAVFDVASNEPAGNLG